MIEKEEYQKCSNCMKQKVCGFTSEFKSLFNKLEEVGKNYNEIFQVTLRCKEFFVNKAYRGDFSEIESFFNIDTATTFKNR